MKLRTGHGLVNVHRTLGWRGWLLIADAAVLLSPFPPSICHAYFIVRRSQSKGYALVVTFLDTRSHRHPVVQPEINKDCGMYGRLGSFFLAQYLAKSDARNGDRRWPERRSDRGLANRDAGVLLTWFALAGVACCVLVIIAALY